MSSLRISLAIAAAVFVAAPAPAATPDLGAVQAAERLLDAVGYDESVDDIIERLSAEVQQQFTSRVSERAEKPIPDELMQQLRKILDTHFRAVMNAHRGEMKRATALAYAGKFTIPELQRLAIIESDPLLKKMRTETPKMMVAGMNFGQKLAEQDRPQLESELKTAIEKYYSTHGDAVSLNGAATTPRG